MTDSESSALNPLEQIDPETCPETCIDYLRSLAWCKQGDAVLVAVGKATPQIIELMKDHEVKVFPGGMVIKMQKSVLSNFQRHNEDGQPLNVVIVWKAAGLEIWYRKVKPMEFPYDAWSSDTAAAYEQERVFIPAEEFREIFAPAHMEILEKANACPTMMPAY